MKKNTKAQ